MTPSFDRRRFLRAGLALPFATSLSSSLRAQPSAATGRIICGYPPGGSVDIVCRKLAEKLTGVLAASVIVENKPGAAGRIAVEELKRAAADGTTLLVTPASIVTMYPHIYRQLSYDPFVDLAPVSTVAVTGFALGVGSMVPESVQTPADFALWAKSNPGLASCGNAGAGSMPHFMALLLARELGVELTHVPFRGGKDAMQAVAAGQCAAALATESSALPFTQAGRMRVLATSCAERSAFLPAAPTFRECGFALLTQQEWFGAFMPAKTPAAAIEKVAAAIQAALRQPDIRDVWQKLGLTPEPMATSALQQAMRTETDFWRPIIRASGFTPEA